MKERSGRSINRIKDCCARPARRGTRRNRREPSVAAVLIMSYRGKILPRDRMVLLLPGDRSSTTSFLPTFY